jgi:hypothetical protein
LVILVVFALENEHPVLSSYWYSPPFDALERVMFMDKDRDGEV